MQYKGNIVEKQGNLAPWWGYQGDRYWWVPI